MTKNDGISASVIKRLPRYYRFIGELINEGCERISSAQLAERMSITASQIRQDLNCFGGFGQPGSGYFLPELYDNIGRILGVDQKKDVVLIGAGNLGRAIAAHMRFERFGMRLCGIFDSDPQKAGLTIASMRIRHTSELSDFLSAQRPAAAILCIPESAAQDIATRLAENGVRAFWNFSHCDLGRLFGGRSDIIVENVHLGDSLMLLSYGLANK